MIPPIQPVKPTNPISFGKKGWPNPDLKKLWDAGKLPTVTHGFYGDLLTPRNVSREHLKPASKGGTKNWFNIVLASRQKNGQRSNFDIRNFINLDAARAYLEQFTGIRFKGFDGEKYKRGIKQTLKGLGVNLDIFA